MINSSKSNIRRFKQALTLPVTWNMIDTILGNISEYFSGADSDTKYDIEMAVTELLENAIKYGRIKGAEPIMISISLDKVRLVVEVTNQAAYGDDLDVVSEYIDTITASDNLKKLFTNRLKFLMDDCGKNESRIGLYRVAYEGQFSLSCSIDGNRLVVTADKVIDR